MHASKHSCPPRTLVEPNIIYVHPAAVVDLPCLPSPALLLHLAGTAGGSERRPILSPISPSPCRLIRTAAPPSPSPSPSPSSPSVASPGPTSPSRHHPRRQPRSQPPLRPWPPPSHPPRGRPQGVCCCRQGPSSQPRPLPGGLDPPGAAYSPPSLKSGGLRVATRSPHSQLLGDLPIAPPPSPGDPPVSAHSRRGEQPAGELPVAHGQTPPAVVPSCSTAPRGWCPQ